MADIFPILRAVIGVTVVLLVPGYSLAVAMFPATGSIGAKRRKPLDPIVKMMLVPALSIVQTLLAVLVIFVLPWDIRATTLLLALTLLSAGLLAIASRRSHLVAPRLPPARVDGRALGGPVIGVFALAAAIFISVTSASNAREMQGPELWLLADTETEQSLEVGVANGSSAGVFRLLVGSPNDASKAVLDMNIALDANETWTQTISVFGVDIPTESVDAVLTRIDRTEDDPLRVRWVREAG